MGVMGWNNLDMIKTSKIKKKRLGTINPIVYVNSAFFLANKTEYSLLIGNVKYAIEGMNERAWKLLNKNKYAEAKKVFNKILESNPNYNDAHVGMFIILLNQNKKAYESFKNAVLTKTDDSNDEYYRIYLNLYNSFMDISDDYDDLIEVLSPERELVAFNKNSYNGNYLKLLRSIKNEQYEKGLKYLEKCMEFKQDNLYLRIIENLLTTAITYSKEKAEQAQILEKELTTKRTQEFASFVKEKDISSAKESLERILFHRELNSQDNYIYYLLLELIEMIQLASSDITFEIMPVTYSYTKSEDALFTFFEAISIGDYKYAYESGKKCKGKLLDRTGSALKVNVYLQLLEFLFSVLEENHKEIENIIQIIVNNIQRGHFKHARSLYENSKGNLQNFSEKILAALFDKGIDLETNESSIHVHVDPEDYYEEEKDEVEKIPEEVLADIEEDDEVEKQLEMIDPAIEESSIIELTELVKTYDTHPLRVHYESQHEYFLNYQENFNNYNYADARVWLSKFDQLLRENNIFRRLEHHYNKIEMAIKDRESGHQSEKEELYKQAFTSMMNKEYSKAYEYLEQYQSINNDINNKGYILLGRLYTFMGKPEKAINNYIRANAISLDPDAYYFLGELHFKKQKWNDAIFFYLAYNDFYPKENISVYISLSECFRRINSTHKVVKYLRIAEEINVDQQIGLYLKNRIQQAEIINKKRVEYFNLQRGHFGQ